MRFCRAVFCFHPLWHDLIKISQNATKTYAQFMCFVTLLCSSSYKSCNKVVTSDEKVIRYFGAQTEVNHIKLESLHTNSLSHFFVKPKCPQMLSLLAGNGTWPVPKILSESTVFGKIT